MSYVSGSKPCYGSRPVFGTALEAFAFYGRAIIRAHNVADRWLGDRVSWGARVGSFLRKPGDGMHDLYSAASDLKNSQGEQIVTAYALHRPDGLWSVMLINKDPDQAHSVKIIFQNRLGARAGFVSPIDVVQFSEAQYQLSADRDQPKPIKSNPPARFVFR